MSSGRSNSYKKGSAGSSGAFRPPRSENQTKKVQFGGDNIELNNRETLNPNGFMRAEDLSRKYLEASKNDLFNSEAMISVEDLSQELQHQPQ